MANNNSQPFFLAGKVCGVTATAFLAEVKPVSMGVQGVVLNLAEAQPVSLTCAWQLQAGVT